MKFAFLMSLKKIGLWTSYALRKGYDDGAFKPNQTVTFVEGLKMAIEGFKIQMRNVDSNFWYAKYLDFVHQHSIFSQYAYYPEQAFSREMMAHLATILLK